MRYVFLLMGISGIIILWLEQGFLTTLAVVLIVMAQSWGMEIVKKEE